MVILGALVNGIATVIGGVLGLRSSVVYRRSWAIFLCRAWACA